MLYVISTEDKNRERIFEAVDLKFPCYTYSLEHGRWQGKPEPSLIIKIDCQPKEAPKVYGLAQYIKSLNGQEAVLVQTFTCESELV